jgi:putative beta-lysine N-acetyltransferase
MPDALIRIGGSLIQHGPFSDRVYALFLADGDMPDILDELDALAAKGGYGKIIAKGRRSDIRKFATRGFRAEAVIPGFFGPREDAVFVGKFLDPGRAHEPAIQRIREVRQVAWGQRSERDGEEAIPEAVSAPGIEFREVGPDDLEAVASCYDEVFESYPFPIDDADHLRREHEGGTRFFTAWDGMSLVAASSMEPGGARGTVEMTDFATLPSNRGEGLATRLLGMMDSAAMEAGKRVAFTIARAVSFGMNITFARRGYRFGGTLVRNTQISGSIESMNVWHKALRAPDLPY